mgnify:CR=1 FL=1
MNEIKKSDGGRREASGRIAYFTDLEPELADFREAVLTGLAATPKVLPAKFFYDEEGSHLFNAICETEDYYVTRTELSIFEAAAADIAARVGPDAVIVEYGCGSAVKIKTLLGILDNPAEYVGIDISREHLLFTIEEIADEFPDLRIGGVCADFVGGFKFPPEAGEGDGTWLGFFPGSTIGNQTPDEAVDLLGHIHDQLAGGGALLMGVDLRKDEAVLRRAYNDSEGVTAAFNLNVLHRINRELGAEIDVDGFSHEAVYNSDKGRVEMHLRADRAQDVAIGDQIFSFAEGETIHTENSYKFTLDQFRDIANRAGFEVEAVWTDPKNWFSVQYLTAV